ncbi:hypothetical protein FAI40_09985 [Acetobacteraceae bacterium]|nr:hypothetical protein FAI40_09985 [Acetobacteraceae bacterium]
MTEDRILKLESLAQATNERIDRVCENQRRFEKQVNELIGLFKGIKKAIWGAGTLAGTVGGVFFSILSAIH